MASSTAVERPRYLVIDWLRGLAIVCMIAYHTVWDFVTLGRLIFLTLAIAPFSNRRSLGFRNISALLLYLLPV